MDQTARLSLACGALAGASAVAFGAFGAHALRSSLAADQLAVFDTAARYQLIHAVLLMIIGLAQVIAPARGWRWSAGFIAVGMLLFSGSLYALVLSGTRVWGAVTPIGGVCLIVGWLTAAVVALRSLRV
jgi:uncharacterized membrane protein YgdD (TMEM256/DUF423 family)